MAPGRDGGANTEKPDPPGISDAREWRSRCGTRPNGWLLHTTRSTGGIGWRVHTHGRVTWARRCRVRCSGSGRRGRCGLSAWRGRELRGRLTVLARCNEQNSGDQEKPDAQQREPQRSRRLFGRRRRVVVVVVIVLVVLVTVRCVVRIAVATHAALIFVFPAGVKRIPARLATFPTNPADPQLDPSRARALGSPSYGVFGFEPPP